MKHASIFIILFFSLLSMAQAQAASKTPKWLSGKGIWVIESNIKTPKNATIYFYNNNRELIYKEVVTNKKINTERVSVRKKLESVLVQAVTAWEKEKTVKENGVWVASRF
jgi:hypothetical protein